MRALPWQQQEHLCVEGGAGPQCLQHLAVKNPRAHRSGLGTWGCGYSQESIGRASNPELRMWSRAVDCSMLVCSLACVMQQEALHGMESIQVGPAGTSHTRLDSAAPTDIRTGLPVQATAGLWLYRACCILARDSRMHRKPLHTVAETCSLRDDAPHRTMSTCRKHHLALDLAVNMHSPS